MEVSYAFILSAGIGSRMGEIGKILSKPLWPVFDRKLIDLQIEYIENLGIKKIYMNVHHQAEPLKAYLTKNFPNLHILHEENLLGIGGAIHNLARQEEIKYKGKVLIVNSDQFLLLSKKRIMEASLEMADNPAILFTKEVENNDLYGAIKVENKKLVGLIPNKNLPRGEYSLTYTGNSIINLEKLESRPGVSHFFDTIANFRNEQVSTQQIKESEYWDYGTLHRYIRSLFRIFNTDENNPFFKFLLQANAIDTNKLNKENKSYNSDQEAELFFSESEFIVNESKNLIKFKDLEVFVQD